ncbi:MAG: hypothetical protein ABIG69_14295 [Bacteroidota bacterium]
MSKQIKKRISGFLVLTVIGLVVVGLGVLNSEVNADESAATATVGNELPVASAANLNTTAIILTENATTTVIATTTVTDNNGCGNIVSVAGVIYRTDKLASCVADTNDCYPSITCTIVSGTCGAAPDVTADYTCTINMEYYADPTDSTALASTTNWTFQATPTDTEGAGTPATDTEEVNSLSALNVTGTIAYGTLALGANTGATNQTAIVTNTGNRSIDVQLSSAADMICTVGVIPVGNQKYAAAGFTYGTGDIALSGTPTTLALTLPQRTSTEITANTYWGLAMPSLGVNGTCSGTDVFTALAD